MLGREDVQTRGLGHTGSGGKGWQEGGVNQQCGVRARPKGGGKPEAFLPFGAQGPGRTKRPGLNLMPGRRRPLTVHQPSLRVLIHQTEAGFSLPVNSHKVRGLPRGFTAAVSGEGRSVLTRGRDQGCSRSRQQFWNSAPGKHLKCGPHTDVHTGNVIIEKQEEKLLPYCLTSK